MKTKEELNAFKEEAETQCAKIANLSDEEMAQVEGGRSGSPLVCPDSSNCVRSRECVYSGQAKKDMRHRCIHPECYFAPDKW